MTCGSRSGALGMRTRRAGFISRMPSRARNRKKARSAASLRRMETAVSLCWYRLPSHSRLFQISNSRGPGGSAPGGEKYSRNWARSEPYAASVCAETLLRFNSSRNRAIWDPSSDSGMCVKKLIHAIDGTAADFGVPGALIAAQLLSGSFVERGQQVEGDVGGLIAGRVGGGNVMEQGADSRLSRQRARRPPHGEIGGEAPGHKACRDRFHIAFDAGDLPRKKHIGLESQLQ